MAIFYFSNKRNILFFLLCSVSIGHSLSQPCSTILNSGHYVVVAAYDLSGKQYAEEYMRRLAFEGIDSHCGTDPYRKYLYVYTSHHKLLQSSIVAMHLLRKNTHFNRAWVRVIRNLSQERDMASVQREKTTARIVDAEKEKCRDYNPEDQRPTDEPKNTTEDEIISIDHVIRDSLQHGSAKDKTNTVPLTDECMEMALLNYPDELVMEGFIEITDTKNEKTITRVVEHTRSVPLTLVNSESHSLIFKTNVLGYKPLEYKIHFPLSHYDTLPRFITRKENCYVITFTLEKSSLGAKHVLDHIYFYNNAAIMLSESKTQLKQILNIMLATPSHYIVLHGHTNGQVFGKLLLANSDGSFFSVQNAKKTLGSSRKLSKERAKIIKKWLMNHGIKAARIGIKAWGGRKMLYDPYGHDARKNARVEMEFVLH